MNEEIEVKKEKVEIENIKISHPKIKSSSEIILRNKARFIYPKMRISQDSIIPRLKDGNVKVGCQTFTLDQVRKALRQLNKETINTMCFVPIPGANPRQKIQEGKSVEESENYFIDESGKTWPKKLWTNEMKQVEINDVLKQTKGSYWDKPSYTINGNHACSVAQVDKFIIKLYVILAIFETYNALDAEYKF